MNAYTATITVQLLAEDEITAANDLRTWCKIKTDTGCQINTTRLTAFVGYVEHGWPAAESQGWVESKYRSNCCGAPPTSPLFYDSSFSGGLDERKGTCNACKKMVNFHLR